MAAPKKTNARPTKVEAEEAVEETPKPKADPPKSTQGMRPVQFSEEPVDGRPILLASSLVRNNEYARNSQSVRAVQDALIDRGYWMVRADGAGYWGDLTQDAAVAETEQEDPVKAAEALGFTVI